MPAPRSAPGRGAPRMGPEATDLPPLDRPTCPSWARAPRWAPSATCGCSPTCRSSSPSSSAASSCPLRELLALGPGAVLELDRAADAPVDVLVNGCLVARGEVVVIDGDFGVRVTAVVER